MAAYSKIRPFNIARLKNNTTELNAIIKLNFNFNVLPNPTHPHPSKKIFLS